MKMARASTSCSACAMRSAAIHAAGPRSDDDDDLGRAGVEVDRAVAATRSALAAATHVLPGPTIRSTRGIDARPVGQRRDRVRAADAEHPVDAGIEGRRQHDGVRPSGRRR